jgi:hypothetical protein
MRTVLLFMALATFPPAAEAVQEPLIDRLQVLQNLMNKDVLSPREMKTLAPVFRFSDDHRVFDQIQKSKKFFPGKLWHVQQTLHSLHLMMGQRVIVTVNFNTSDSTVTINGKTLAIHRDSSITRQLRAAWTRKTAARWILMLEATAEADTNASISPEGRFVISSLAWSENYTGDFKQTTNHGSASAVLDQLGGKPLEGSAKLNCDSSPLQGDLKVRVYGRSLTCHFESTRTPQGIHVEMLFNGVGKKLTADFSAKNLTPTSAKDTQKQACEAAKFFDSDPVTKKLGFNKDRSLASSNIHEEIDNYLVSTHPHAQSNLMKLCETYYGPRLSAGAIGTCSSNVCSASDATPVFDALSVRYGEVTPLGKLMNWQNTVSEGQQSAAELLTRFQSDLKGVPASSAGIKGCLDTTSADASCELSDAEVQTLAAKDPSGALKNEYMVYRGALDANQQMQQEEGKLTSGPGTIKPRTLLEASAGVSVAARVAGGAEACCADAECRATFQANSSRKSQAPGAAPPANR